MAKQQVKNALFYMLPVLVGNLLPIVTLPLFTHILTPMDYGIFALSQVYAIFVTGIANFGLITGYERNFFEFKEPKQRAGLLYSVLLFSLVSLSFFAMLTFFFSGFLAKEIMGSENFGHILFWSFCSTGVTGIKTYFLTYYKNTGNAKAFAWYTVDENLVGVAISLFMVLYLKTGVIGLIYGPLIAGSSVFLILLFKFLRNTPFVVNGFLLKECLKISVPLTPRIFFGVIGTQFDKYMIGILNTVGGVGVYNIGQKFGYIVFAFMTAVQNMFSPQVYQRMFALKHHGGRSVGKYLTPYLYLCIGAALCISLFSEEVIKILTPPSYHDAIDITSILAMLYSTYFFGKQPQLIYAKKTGITSWLTIITIAINVAINIPFIKTWGVIGAAYGTLLAGIISGAITFVVSQKYYNIRWEYKKVVAIYTLFFATAFLSIFLRDWGLNYSIRLVFKVIFIAVYVFLGFNIGILSQKSVSMLRSLITGDKKLVKM